MDQLRLGETESLLELRRAWDCVKERLKSRVNKPSFHSWVKAVVPLSFENGVASFGTTSRFAKHWFESKHLDLIREVLCDELGMDVRARFETIERSEEEPPILTEDLPQKPARPKLQQDEETMSLPLNQRHIFDSFVVGPGNRLAHAAASAVAEAPGKTYNPLFLYGTPGLGKTHLLHAVGHQIQLLHPDARVAYLSGEAFTYQYVTAIRDHKIQAFRRRYRGVDVWLIDDVQFLIGKERTEEEFFHTFNALYDTGKQIVLSSDRSPKELDLDARLLSRFESGLVADIAPPDFETRAAILQRKAANEQMCLPDEVVLYVAKIIRSNIRQLEGALVKLHAYASLMKMPVTRELAQEVLHGYFAVEPELNPQTVQLEVCRLFNMNLEDVTGSGRSRDVVLARQVAMYLSRMLTSASLPAIGRAFGKDHSTVIHACRKVAQLVTVDPKLAATLKEVQCRLKNGCG